MKSAKIIYFLVFVLLATLSTMQVSGWLTEEAVACSITFSDAGGNRHQFIGQGIVY